MKIQPVAMLLLFLAPMLAAQEPQPAGPSITVGKPALVRDTGDGQYELIEEESLHRIAVPLHLDQVPDGNRRWYRLLQVELNGQKIEAMFRLPPFEAKRIKTEAGELLGTNLQPGSYLLEFGDKSLRFTVEGDTPVPPVPPGPISKAPFESSGFAVLVIEESSDRSDLPAEQASIFTASEFHTYIRDRCETLDGEPERERYFYRVWDDDLTDEQLRFAPAKLQAAYQKIKPQATTLPWIAISDGQGGWQGPLPKTLDETMALLKKWGDK